MTVSRSRKRYAIITAIILLVAALVGARLYLNVWLLNYVNNVLANIEGYEGSVEDIDINLYRGAYKIHDLKILKKNGNIPVPFVSITTTDLSIQWGALLRGRIVSNIDLVEPNINFAVNRSGSAEQTGQGVDWTKPIKDLMPIDINLVTFTQGTLTYQDFSKNPKVNVYIKYMNGEIDNLRNVEKESEPLPSRIYVSGNSIGKGSMEMLGRINILKQVPDMDIKVRLEKVNLPALSNYSLAYAGVDIERGNLDVYSNLIIKNNRLSGFIKPLATNIAIIDLKKDQNPIKLVWETLVGAVVEIFSNQRKDQFATSIELQGNLDNVETNTLDTIFGIIRNAFIQSFSKGFSKDN